MFGIGFNCAFTLASFRAAASYLARWFGLLADDRKGRHALHWVGPYQFCACVVISKKQFIYSSLACSVRVQRQSLFPAVVDARVCMLIRLYKNIINNSACN